MVFDPENSSTLYIDLAKSNSRSKRQRIGQFIVGVFLLFFIFRYIQDLTGLELTYVFYVDHFKQMMKDSAQIRGPIKGSAYSRGTTDLG